MVNAFKGIIKNIVFQFNKYSPKPILIPFRMSVEEKTLFDKIIKNSFMYLEFGTGGSTFRVLQKSQAIVHSVESSQNWLNYIKKYSYIKHMQKQERLNLLFVDIGETGKWGHPIVDSSKILYPNYSTKIFSLIQNNKLDTVLIDGRFRVACVLKTIIECYKNKTLTLLIHDFHRKRYHIVLKYLSIVDTLGVFNIKPNIDIVSILDDYKKYKYISE